MQLLVFLVFKKDFCDRKDTIKIYLIICNRFNSCFIFFHVKDVTKILAFEWYSVLIDSFIWLCCRKKTQNAKYLPCLIFKFPSDANHPTRNAFRALGDFWKPNLGYFRAIWLISMRFFRFISFCFRVMLKIFIIHRSPILIYMPSSTMFCPCALLIIYHCQCNKFYPIINYLLTLRNRAKRLL